MKIDIKERAREIMKIELANRALDLVLGNGYGQTVEELADALGISRATFFRYLGSKEEIVVVAMLGSEDLLADAYREAPADALHSTWQRLKAAYAPQIAIAEASPGRVRAQLAFIRSEPALVGRLHRARRPQIERLGEAMVDAGDEPFRATMLAAAATAVFDNCWSLWASGAADDLQEIVDRGFSELEGLRLPPPSAAGKPTPGWRQDRRA